MSYKRKYSREGKRETRHDCWIYLFLIFHVKLEWVIARSYITHLTAWAWVAEDGWKVLKKGMCYYFFSCIQVKIACDLSFCQATTVIVAAWWLGRSIIIIIIIMIACYEAFNLFSIEEWDCWDYLHCVM